ncbi:unnamed protein product, partial [Adineta ricciae]
MVNNVNSSSAVCFLTRQAAFHVLEFASQLATVTSSVDVFILIDHNNVSIPSSPTTFRFIQLNETLVSREGFQKANIFGSKKICSAWDKALYHFTRIATNYSFVWFVEEDVFIPTTQAFLSLHELYSPYYDLITEELIYHHEGNPRSWYHYYSAPGTFIPPWVRGMVCAVGCSRRMLSAVDEYARWRGELTFLEFLFHTIAAHDKEMKIVTPLELNTIIFRQQIFFEQIKKRPNNIWHPMKNFLQQIKWRQNLINIVLADKNHTLNKFHALKNRIINNINSNSISDLNHLLSMFERVKHQFTPTERQQLRHLFVRLANDQSEEISSLLHRLADHAFKLSEAHINTTMEEDRTEKYVALENKLVENKKTILWLVKNGNGSVDEKGEIGRLRREAKQLTLNLTREIQCERRYIKCNRNRTNKLIWLKLSNRGPSSVDFDEQLIASDSTRTNVSGQMNDIEKRHEKLKQRASQAQTEKNLLNQVAQWEKESIGKIQLAAKKARTEIQQFIKDSNTQIANSLNKVSTELRSRKRANNYTDRDIENLNNLLQSCGEHMKQQNELNVIKKDFSPSELIKIAKNFAPTQETIRPTIRNARFAPTREQQALSPRLERYSLPPEIGFLSERPTQRADYNTLPPPQYNPTPQTRRRPIDVAPNSNINSDPYPSISFNVNSGTDKNIQRLFESIGTLAPMNKIGPMSGDCDYETTQMESFLAQTFQFRNIPGEYIVHGVKSFRLGRPPFLMDPNTLIRFPGTGRVAFAMTAQEILDWQQSYRVYADEDARCINKIFIRRALQGLTKSGEEAFAMKFVVRISQ